MNMWRTRTFWAALILVFVVCVHAQLAPEPQTTIRKQVNLVLVDVIVTDPKGAIVNGLTAKDFEITDEGAPRDIVHFGQDEIPTAIALVVDISSSMEFTTAPFREGLMHALPSLKSTDRVALFSFSEHCRMEEGLTRNFKRVAGWIRALGTGGVTNIEDAVYDAAHYLRKAAPAERRIIIVVSDMVATIEGRMPVQEELMKSEAAVFGIRVPSAADAAASKTLATLKSKGLTEQIERELRREWAGPVVPLATATGGVVFDVQRPDGIQPAVESLFRLVRSRYTLGFYPDPPGRPGSTRRLEVRLKNGNADSAPAGTFLTYRTQYRVPRDEGATSRTVPGSKIRK